jgi:hypothetical protein
METGMVAFRCGRRINTLRVRERSFRNKVTVGKQPETTFQSTGSRSEMTLEFGPLDLAHRSLAMPSDVVRNTPLSVLVVLADANLDVAQMLPALNPHYGLVCTSPEQGVEAARQFEPDIVLIDLRVSDPRALIRDLNLAASGSHPAFVALPLTARPAGATSPEFMYSLAQPATAGELEQLLWQIGRDLATRTPLSQPAGREMIG